jgi:hypothetical protein
MTASKTTFVISFLAIAAASACVKNSNSSQHNSTGNAVLTLSKSSVKRGEQLMALTNESNPAAIIKWTTTASNTAVILPDKTQAAVMFARAGTYSITASYYNVSDTVSAYDSSSSSLVVTDSIYSPSASSTGDTTNLSGGIVLIPVSASDSGLIVLVQTTNLYGCTSYLTAYAAGGPTNPSLEFNFNWAEVVLNNGTSCGGIQNPATAFVFFGLLSDGGPIGNGQYAVTVELNQVNYQGSLTVTDTDYTFTWNYTSGVIISPLQIKKQ